MLIGRLEHVAIMMDWLNSKKLHAEAVLDNDHKKQGTKIKGTSICAPAEILEPYDSKILILIYSPKYWEDILHQFESFGYRENQEIQVLDRPSEKKNKQMIKKGLKCYHSMQQKYGQDVMIFFMNCPLGDFYLLGLYLKEYCKAHAIHNYVVAGESVGIEKLANMFELKNIQRLTTEDSNSLCKAWIFLGEEQIRMKPLTIWQRNFRFNSCMARQQKGFSFMDTFSRMIYDLPGNIRPQFPNRIRQTKEIEQLFIQKHLLPHMTILLSPFAYSIQTLSESFWIQLSDQLQMMGYSIAVNIGEDHEKNFIPDSVSLALDFNQIMDVMEYGGIVIGLRSGFFDITSQAKCKRIIIYPPREEECVAWNSTDIRFCSLEKMGLCSDAVELEYTTKEELMEQIIECLNRKC